LNNIAFIFFDRIYPGETKAKDGFTGQAGFSGLFCLQRFPDETAEIQAPSAKIDHLVK